VRILWLKTELLHPIDKGGRIRTYHMLKELRREHHITYLTLDDGNSSADACERAIEYCHELIRIPHATREKFTAGFYRDLARNLATKLPYFIMKYESAAMRNEIEKRTEGGAFDVLVCDFLQTSVNLPAVLPLPTLLFQHNVEAVIWSRHYKIQKNPLKRLYLYEQWRKAFAFERDMCRRFNQVVAVSREDSQTMNSEYGINSPPDVPTGVDTEYFRPAGCKPDAQNLVFTGSMDWLPNDDAVRFFIQQIMPLVRQKVPDVTFTVVGRKPYPHLVELSKRDPSVIVTGRVEDVRPYIERSAAYVVPIRIGGGTRLKIYEAMAMEKPVVSTTIGAEGLPLTDRELLLADSPEAFSEAVVRLLKDEELAQGLGMRGASLVRNEFGWDKAAAKFSEICERVAKGIANGSAGRAEERLQAVS
jgi:glycosyltransferase involved in cell wall biosynthesis